MPLSLSMLWVNDATTTYIPTGHLLQSCIPNAHYFLLQPQSSKVMSLDIWALFFHVAFQVLAQPDSLVTSKFLFLDLLQEEERTKIINAWFHCTYKNQGNFPDREILRSWEK
jgi:hypothetical protein